MDLYLNVIIILSIGLFILAISVRNLRIRLADSIYLSIAAICAFIFGMCFLFIIYYLWQNDIELFLLFQKIALGAILTIFISGYFYYDAFITVRPPMKRMVPFLSVYVVLLTLCILNLTSIIDHPQFHAIVIMAIFAYGFIFHIFAIWAYVKILKLWNRLLIKIDLLSLVMVGISCLLVSIAFGLETYGILTNLSYSQNLLLGIAIVLMIIGIGILGVNNLKWGDYIYYIPVPVHMIMIYNEGGSMVFSRQIHVKSGHNLFRSSDFLISGCLTGFTQFFKEILGAKTRIKHIDTTEFEFLFRNLPEEAGTIVVISSGANYFISKSIDRFIQSISSELLNNIKTNTHISSFEADFEDLIQKAFPYLVLNRFNENA